MFLDGQTAALLLAGVGTYLVVWACRRWADKRERIKACAHRLELEANDVWNAVYRCALGCGYQEPARDFIDGEMRKRQEYLDVLAIRRCPKCGGEL